jgi:hypothetical protein
MARFTPMAAANYTLIVMQQKIPVSRSQSNCLKLVFAFTGICF